MNAEDILAADNPADLFPFDADKSKDALRRLRSRWHPDRTGGSEAVFSHITTLYKQAEAMRDGGLWDTGKCLRMTNGHYLAYRRKHKIELGDMLVGDAHVTFVIGNDYSDLTGNAEQLTSNFRFADPSMRREVRRYLPKLEFKPIHTKSGVVVSFKKDPDTFCLRDVMALGDIDPKHVAWILSRLYNIKCYFAWAGLCHQDISPDTFFISPSQHIGVLLGGWWYARRENDKLIALPKRTITFMPTGALASEKASRLTDAELVKATGREILGDIYGSKLLASDAPMPMVQWLRQPANENAFLEYDRWHYVLEACFGPRKFVELKVTEDMIYG